MKRDQKRIKGIKGNKRESEKERRIKEVIRDKKTMKGAIKD